jgi:succinate-acetate transporter protein
VDANGHMDRTRIYLRPVGSGLPLGFFSFGIGMLLLGCSAIGWIPMSEQHDVGMTLMAFVFPLEGLAAVFAFLARDTLGATTLGLFTSSWLTLGWSDLESAEGARSVTSGIYLFGFGTAVFLIALLSMRAKPFFTLLLFTACTRMVVAGIYEVGLGSHEWLKVGGGFGLALAALAMYGGTALALEDAHRRDVLPLFRQGRARRALEDDLVAQVARVETEPGVRQQL